MSDSAMQLIYDLIALCIFFGALFAVMLVPGAVRELKAIGAAAAALVIGIAYDLYQWLCHAAAAAARKKRS